MFAENVMEEKTWDNNIKIN